MSKHKNLIEQTMALSDDMNHLTVDNIAKEAPKFEPIPQEMSLKERAKLENVLYIEPKRKLRAIGKLPENQKKAHDYDWEYVKGIFENIIVAGEPLSFWFVKYPGDADCLWEIPCNTPVYVPRMIAKHLEENLAYHTFDYREKPITDQKVDDFTHKFIATGTKYRGKFRSVNAFS